jgi:hypothetical protein
MTEPTLWNRLFDSDCAAVASYIDNLLPDAERQAFEHHLGGCADCREMVEAFSAETSATPPPDVVTQVRHSLSLPAKARVYRFPMGPALVAAAVLLVILAGLVTMAPTTQPYFHALHVETPEYEVLVDAVSHPAGGEVVLGLHRGEVDARAWIVYRDADGHPQWKRLSNETVTPQGILRTSADTFLVISSWRPSPTGPDQDILLMNLDRNGTLLWKTRIAGLGWEFPGSLCETDDGYVVTGYSRPIPRLPGSPDLVQSYTDDADWIALVVGISRSGDIAFQSGLHGITAVPSRVVSCKTDDGFAMVDTIGPHLRLTTYDPSGDPRTSLRLEADTALSITRMAQMPDGNLILVGQTQTHSWVARMTSEGEPMQGMALDHARELRIYDLAVQDNGTLLVAGNAMTGTGSSDVWVAAVASDGTSPWSRVFDSGKTDVAFGIHTTEARTVIAANSMEQRPDRSITGDAWLLEWNVLPDDAGDLLPLNVSPFQITSREIEITPTDTLFSAMSSSVILLDSDQPFPAPGE